MTRGRTLPAALLCAALLPTGGAGAQTVDAALPGALRARSLGPADTGGRVAVVEVDPDDPSRLFVGAATGGLWRSANGGTTWTPVFERAPVQTIGAVTVSPARPDAVWVGTGTPGDAGGSGLGVFRSDDGGESWRRTGLRATGPVRRIVAHPRDPDVAWAAVPGPAGRDDVRRGVFRTGDGGRSWEKVLFVDDGTGAVDLALDPADPDRLLAAARRVRNGAVLPMSGPEGGGLFLSEDGGRSWERMGAGAGVPEDATGVAVAFGPSGSGIAYGVVAEDGRHAVLRSRDGGRRWREAGAWEREGSDPVAVADLRPDPGDVDRVYRLGRTLALSRDGGETFDALGDGLHPGVRDLWIDPADPRHLVAGTDGGVFVSRDRGRTWRFLEGLPLARVRSVSVDMAVPFGLYAGIAEEGAWRRASDAWGGGSDRATEWTRIARVDPATVLVDPRDSRFVYAAGPAGGLVRVDRRTGERQGVDAWAPRGVELRFGGSVPLAFDPFRPEMIYVGSQLVHRTSDRGETWQVISGDMSEGRAGSGQPGSISSIAPSPVQEEMIWVGTDDGRLHLTRSSGGTWTELTSRLPEAVTDGARISHVEASKHHSGTAFVAVDRTRAGDRGGYLYRTGDYGRSWERIGADGALPALVRTVEQDPLFSGLLFAGTNRGLYLSLDGGSRWLPWTSEPPAVPVLSLVVHPRDYDLVIGTDGRGVLVLDDVRPLRALARDPGLLARPLHLFRPPPAYLRHVSGSPGPGGAGDHRFRGGGRPYGALLTYHVGAAATGRTLQLVIADEDGEVARRMEVPGTRGLHRVSWNLGMDAPAGLGDVGDPAGDGPPVLPVLPGSYTVRLDGEGVGPEEETLRVLPDPRSDVTAERRRVKQEALLVAAEMGRIPGQAEERLERLETALLRTLGTLRDREGEAADTLRERARDLRRAARELQRRAREATLRHGRLLRSLSSSFDAPTESQRIALQELEQEIGGLTERANDFLLGRISLYNDRLRRAGLDALPELEEVGR